MHKNKDFRLQKVLEVREIVEKEKQKNLSVSKKKLHSEQEELRDMKNRLDDFTDDMNKINTAKVYEIREHHDYLNTLKQNVTDKNEDLTVVRGDVEDKRKSLLEARKERKILENLKEKRIAEAREDADRKEQARMDELANRKRNSI